MQFDKYYNFAILKSSTNKSMLEQPSQSVTKSLTQLPRSSLLLAGEWLRFPINTRETAPLIYLLARG